MPYLDASAALDNGSLTLNVVNRHPTQALEAEIEAEDKQFSGPVAISEVNGPDIKAENDFGKTTVRAVATSAAATGQKFRYSFPPHSFTMLRMKLV